VITHQDLAGIVIRRAIFHDVPRKLRGSDTQATLSEIETSIDPARKAHLRERLTRVLGSKSAYEIEFSAGQESPVPLQVRQYTRRRHGNADFVSMSQIMAEHLLELQHGGVSAGLLCVLDITVDASPGIVLMKLEREAGAQLQPKLERGKRTFDMSIIDNLVLTDGTRLFKTAMFLRFGDGDDDFRATACDAQLRITSSDDVAKFWLRFIGCSFVVAPRVATQRFFDAALQFINDDVADPVQKTDIYEHLHSQLKAQRQTFAPRTFIEEFIPKGYRQAFEKRLLDAKVSLTTFKKDLSDLESRLRRRSFRSERGAVVTVPEDHADIIEITKTQILVNDPMIWINER
jgi:hypothetical protein